MNNYDINASRAELASCWINIQKSGNILRRHKRRLMDNILEIAAMQQFRNGQRIAAVHGSINARARLQKTIQSVEDKNNRVMRCITGRDCDGFSYNFARVIKCKSIFALWKDIEHEYDFADGPMHIWFEAIPED